MCPRQIFRDFSFNFSWCIQKIIIFIMHNEFRRYFGPSVSDLGNTLVCLSVVSLRLIVQLKSFFAKHRIGFESRVVH